MTSTQPSRLQQIKGPTHSANSASILNVLSRFYIAGLDLLFPPSCAGCGKAGHLFCPSCSQNVLPIEGPICDHCGKPQEKSTEWCTSCLQGRTDSLQLIRSSSVYSVEPLRSAILQYKKNPELAYYLARYLACVYRQPPWSLLDPPIDVVIPVPLHDKKFRERGYNQSELLATSFCQLVDLPMAPAWISRQHFTRSQVGLIAKERQENVSNAFLATEDVAGYHLLLIDDVYTTGATLNACAKVAMEKGAASVSALTLATQTSTLDFIP